MPVELTPRWEQERAAWMVRHARTDAARRRAEVALRRMRARQRREQGAGEIPAVEVVMPWWPVSWVREAPRGARGRRAGMAVGVGVLVLVVWGPALILGRVIYAAWWAFSPKWGPIRVSLLWSMGLASAVSCLAATWVLGGYAWVTWWISGAYFSAGWHAWQHGWIVTEEWVYRVRDRAVEGINRLGAPRDRSAQPVAELVWAEGEGAMDSAEPGARFGRVRAVVEKVAERVHAGEEAQARHCGWQVERTAWGGRTYRDPRFDTLTGGAAKVWPLPAAQEERREVA